MFSHRYEEADGYFVRAQALVERRFGHFDRTVAICLQDRGDVALMDHRFPEAEQYLKQALELAESPRVKVDVQMNQYAHRLVQDPNKGQMGDVLNDLGLLYKETKRYGESEEAFKKSLKLKESQYSKNSLYLCNPLFNYAQTLLADHKYSEAETQLRRCLAILKSGKSDHPMMSSVQQSLDKVVALKEKAASGQLPPQ